MYFETYNSHQPRGGIVEKNSSKNQSIGIINSWVDVNWKSTIDEDWFGNWCKTIVGENKCTIRNMQGVGSGLAIKGVQRCFFMDMIQIFERDSTKASITQNWVWHYYTTSTLGQI